MKNSSDCLWDRGVGWRLTGKLHKAFLRGDKNVLHFNRGGHGGMCNCHNSSNFTLKMCTFHSM